MKSKFEWFIHKAAVIKRLHKVGKLGTEYTMGQWVMGQMDQMGRQKLMGYMGHGSTCVDPWPINFFSCDPMAQQKILAGF
jgi:hypothetical protein